MLLPHYDQARFTLATPLSDLTTEDRFILLAALDTAQPMAEIF